MTDETPAPDRSPEPLPLNRWWYLAGGLALLLGVAMGLIMAYRAAS